MEFNETVRIRPQKQKGQRIYIFDCSAQPKEVDLTSLGQAEITFGRDAGNDIVLLSHLASRRHGKLTSENGQLCVTDFGSTNGLIYDGDDVIKAVVGKDDFIRIDDGVETIPDGVLIIFASDEYADTWESVSSGEWNSEYNLSRFSPVIDATIERSGDLFYLNVQNSDLYINKKVASGRIVLHEKDVIACNDVRLVFTSNALYVNRLNVNAVTDSKLMIKPSTINNSVEENSKDILISANYEENPLNFAQGSLPVENEDESYDSDFIAEPVNKKPIQQAVQHENNQPNLYQNDNTSAISDSGLRNFFASNAGYYVLSFVIAIIILGIAVALWTSQGELALIVILACAIFGWQALNRIQPAMFIWMSWTGWIIYFCVKFILSAMIGLFVAPFKIGKLIAGAISGSMM